MRILIRNIMLSVVSLLALSACSNDDSDSLALVPLTIKATIQGAETRVAPDADGVDQFEVGDVITVYCSDSRASGEYMGGVDYTFDGENWVTDNPLYFDPSDTKSYIVYAYANTQSSSNTLLDQSKGLAPDMLRSSDVTCSARNPEVVFSFTHLYSKITLNFSSAVTDCKLIMDEYGNNATICHLIDNGKTAEALLAASITLDLKVQVTVGSKIYTGRIGSTAFEANHHYIYNIKISDVLTVDSGTSIAGFEESNEEPFEATQQN